MNQEGENKGDLAIPAIPLRLQRRAGRLLAAGATFEETLGELHRRGKKDVTLKTVQDFFRSNPELQRERIESRRQAVEELKLALARPDSLHRSLAEAALFTGLTELTAPRGLYRSQLNNWRLQLHTQRLKRQKATLERQVAHTRLKLAMARWEMARLKLADLEEELEQHLRQHQLDPGAIATIRKIHGLMAKSLAALCPGDGSGHRPPAAEDNSRREEENSGITQTGNPQ